MPRTRTTTNPWEPELLRLGRRLLRGAVATGTEMAVGGLDSIESAITKAVAPAGERSRLRLVASAGSGSADCLADE
jgi:alkylhydroperoxidase family enzyme